MYGHLYQCPLQYLEQNRKERVVLATLLLVSLLDERGYLLLSVNLHQRAHYSLQQIEPVFGCHIKLSAL